MYVVVDLKINTHAEYHTEHDMTMRKYRPRLNTSRSALRTKKKKRKKKARPAEIKPDLIMIA